MNIFLCSDHHFGHKNILKFQQSNGDLCRPGFEDVDHMNEVIIENHNSVVKPSDKVYFLGDVAFNKRILHEVMPRLNGKKRLILGNHDCLKMTEYMQYFEKILESRHLVSNVVMTHRPILLDSGDHHREVLNIHGHTHNTVIQDSRYLNVCMENINYTPIHWDEVVAIFERRGFKVGNF